MSTTKLDTHPVHLGLGATADIEPEFTGDMHWYEQYAARHAADGVEGRLVTLHHFTESWESWEMHPFGCEVVICTSGQITLIQQTGEGTSSEIKLGAGDCAVNAPGVWHTADVDEDATVLFITAGAGTQGRPR